MKKDSDPWIYYPTSNIFELIDEEEYEKKEEIRRVEIKDGKATRIDKEKISE